MTSNAAPSPSGPNDQKQALLEAFDDVLRAEAERRAEEAARQGARPRRRFSPIVAAGLFAIVMLCGGLAVSRPPWLGFAEPYVDPPAVEDASLRLAIYRARQRVELYRAQHHAMPPSLAQAGVSDPGLRMTVVSGTLYVIEGGNDSVSLALRSDEPVRPFLGDAYEVVVNGRGR